MKQNKYILSTHVRNQLRVLRKNKCLSAENVSMELGKSKAWIEQIERGKIQSIKQDDLVKLLTIYTNFNNNEILQNGILVNFLYKGVISVEKPIKATDYFDMEEVIKIVQKYITFCKFHKEECIEELHTMLRCMNMYSAHTNAYLSNFTLLEQICQRSNLVLSDEEYIYRTFVLNKKIENILKEELEKLEKGN